METIEVNGRKYQYEVSPKGNAIRYWCEATDAILIVGQQKSVLWRMLTSDRIALVEHAQKILKGKS